MKLTTRFFEKARGRAASWRNAAAAARVSILRAARILIGFAAPRSAPITPAALTRAERAYSDTALRYDARMQRALINRTLAQSAPMRAIRAAQCGAIAYLWRCAARFAYRAELARCSVLRVVGYHPESEYRAAMRRARAEWKRRQRWLPVQWRMLRYRAHAQMWLADCHWNPISRAQLQQRGVQNLARAFSLYNDIHRGDN